MSVSPNVMDTLYRHGTIEYVPYDLLTPFNGGRSYSNSQQCFGLQTNNMQNAQMHELQAMSQGPITLYPKNRGGINVNTIIPGYSNITKNYNQINASNYQDTFTLQSSFTPSNSPLGSEAGSVVDEIRGIKNGYITPENTEGSIRASLISEDDKKGIGRSSNTKMWPKALISVAAMVLTLLLLFKHSGSSSSVSGGSFWSKLNPLNWFK